MNSIEKLREFSRWFPGIYATENVGGEDTSYIIHNYPPVEGMNSVGDDIRGLADEIESEIAERYMELPVDADGVPIRVGETCYDKRTGEPFEVSSVEWNGVCWSAWSKPEQRHIYDTITHVKPRTVEDVLREFTDEVIEWSGYSGPVSGDKTWSGMAGKYADEIRAMFGEEADE